MKRERTTLVGTPTIIAPGAIFLVGEFRLPEEEVTVLAALSSHATAQYFPDVVPLSPLVATVVERAKTHLGEAAAALPSGSVLLSPARARVDGQVTFDTGPAIAIATAAAVFETAGKAISESRDDILAVARAGHRAIHDGIGAEGELVAALHGGLVKVISQAKATRRVETLAAPAALHLVVFQAGQALFPVGWLASVRQFAERNRIAYAKLTNELLEQASRFATELSEGNTTAAIASAGRYGDCIIQLAAAASAPLQSVPFVQAMDLAREFGGVAKTTSPRRSGMGVALFATPEAANLFTRACQPPLVPLGFELERSGVRCLASATAHTPAPETGPSAISAQAIVRGALEERTTERALPALAPRTPSTPWSVVTQPEPPKSEPAPQTPDLQPKPAAHRNRTRLGAVIIGAVLVVAALVAGKLTVSLGRARTAATRNHAAALPVPSLPPPRSPEPAAPADVGIVPTQIPTPSEPAASAVLPSPAPQPPSAKSHASLHQARASKSTKANARKLAAVAPPTLAPPSPRPPAPVAPREPSKPAPRAGRLSKDDF